MNYYSQTAKHTLMRLKNVINLLRPLPVDDGDQMTCSDVGLEEGVNDIK